MKQITYDTPEVEDIDVLWKWGEENWELWGSEKNKWFSKESLNRWITNQGDDVLVVARLGQEPIGMCMMTSMRDWAFCFGLFVDEFYRGKGIGKRLLKASTEKLKSKGIETVCLLVDTKNTRAKKFYEREGFTEGYQFYIMEKDI